MVKKSLSSLPQAEASTYKNISAEPIDLSKMILDAHHPKAGAVVFFSGEVRNHSAGREVLYLDYEAYDAMADKMIDGIIETAKTKFELHYARCVHRTGKVGVCETAIVVFTCSSHRAEAYAANRYIIDRVKHEAPIWKREYFADGTDEWGHNCSCHNHGEAK